MDFKLIEKLPSAEEYNFLRESVGWGIYDINVINNSLINSLYCIIIYQNEQLIGMGRIIGDKGLCFYIQDVIVLPEFQRKGLGNKIMTKIMEYISNNANNNSIIGLMSSFGKEKFYEKYGFTVRPNNKLGSGMTIFYKK